MELKRSLLEMGKKAKEAATHTAMMDSDTKDRILRAMATALRANAKAILTANKRDVKAAKAKGRTAAIVDRLLLNEARIKSMALGLEEVARLEDPVGRIGEMNKRPNGLMIGKMRVPIGVIGIIYEARPNVTADCAGLCLKSGNVIILRGGTEAINSNRTIAGILRKSGIKHGLHENAINFIDQTDRKAVGVILGMTGVIDLVIPRGGESLIREVVKMARVPVIKHYKGVCHVYVDEYADLNKAEKIALNAKLQRPGVCNAMETLLVHRDVAARFLPSVAKKLKEGGVEIRGCPFTRKVIKGAGTAKESDWYEEYLGLILSVKVVDSIEDAIAHIRKYGSMHSDAIVTENYDKGMAFLREVDSSCVYLNASTRFTDGNQFGKGAEMGISTDKLHARGPMGIHELTSYKYVIFGSGQIRE